MKGSFFNGADNGNRTRIKSLGSSRSTIELYPQSKENIHPKVKESIQIFTFIQTKKRTYKMRLS